MRKFSPKTIKLSAILLTFLIPFALAGWYYRHPQALALGGVNHGTLLQPTLNLASLQLSTLNGQPFTEQQIHGHWWLIYVTPDSCDKTCQTHLYDLHQIRTATGKDRTRVARALISFSTDTSIDRLLQAAQDDTQHLLANKQQFQQALQALPSTTLALQQGYLYLVDPLGNLVLGYPPHTKPEDLLKDLQRLLRISQIG
jgi:cytochrome oxidase Cu insertion factor (SCO1/SenC/PrrC family)